MRFHLEAHGDVHRRERRQALGIDPQWIALGVAAERAVGEHVKAGNAQPLGTGMGLARTGLPIAPGRARAGVEQDGYDREVHAATRDFFRRQVRQPLGQRAPAITSAGLEMPPARVERNSRRIGKPLARDGERRLHRGFQPVGVELEPLRLPVHDILQDLARPLTDRDGGAEISQIVSQDVRPRTGVILSAAKDPSLRSG